MAKFILLHTVSLYLLYPKGKPLFFIEVIHFQIPFLSSRLYCETVFVLLAHYQHLFTADRQTPKAYLGILKSYLREGCRFIAHRFAYPRRFYSPFRMIEDLHISFKKLKEALVKSFAQSSYTLKVNWQCLHISILSCGAALLKLVCCACSPLGCHR